MRSDSTRFPPNEKFIREIKKIALSDDNVLKFLDGKECKKVIYVKGKIINLVV